ncbi:MAG: hypothetical protein ACW99G_11590 [Candidatus Thorarchaeota archaeon]|jgi:hypothetical protein
MAKQDSPKLNNGQRKAIASSKEQQINELSSLLADHITEQRKIVEAEVMDAYGVTKLYDKIAEYEQLIRNIKDEIMERGFHSQRVGTRQAIAGFEPAQKIHEALQPLMQQKIDLINMRQSIIEKCWTAETVDDIPAVPDNIEIE